MNELCQWIKDLDQFYDLENCFEIENFFDLF